MAGNSIGELFRVTTFGESHGAALGAILDGCPPRIPLDASMIQADLDRRKPGTSRYVTQRREADEVRILSGVFEGKTTGTPIALVIDNTDQRSKDYSAIAATFRPGHADWSYQKKYGIRDYRGGGRASARETAARVAAGAVAKVVLRTLYQTCIRAYVSRVGTLTLDFRSWDEVANNPFFCPNAEQVPDLERYIDEIRKSGDSIGAEVCLRVEGVPAGWGEPVFDRLDADLAKALMSINAAKAVAIGDGFAVVTQRGSEHRDEITPQGFLSNHAGGILGGISSGQELRASVAFKPTSSILIPGRSVDLTGAPTQVVTQGRHDPCVGLRAVPIVEAMAAIVLLDHALRQRAQCGEGELPFNSAF